MALRLLEERVDVYAGMKNQERPLVGVRGEQKDLTRVARLLKCKWDKARQEPRPITLCLLDDKAKDGWGKCQVNDQRCLAVVPAYTAISEQDAETFSAIMEEILPLDTLGRFYRCVLYLVCGVARLTTNLAMLPRAYVGTGAGLSAMQTDRMRWCSAWKS